MGAPLKVIAILSCNPALSAVLCMILAARPSLRVRDFAGVEALAAYMRIAPVDIVVCDDAVDGMPAEAVIARLRGDDALGWRPYQAMALVRRLDRDRAAALRQSGVDEVLAKPLSPVHLEERVFARLRRGPVHTAPGAPLRAAAGATPLPRPLPDNVVPLFGP